MTFLTQNQLINGLKNIKKNFSEIYIDKVFFLDYYTLENSKKTELGDLVYKAKNPGNKKLLDEVLKIIIRPINKLIQKEKIDGVIFIPSTIKREIQFLEEIEKGLNLNLPKVKIVKISKNISQKSIFKNEDRSKNSKETFELKTSVKTFQKILIIDDTITSGATMNEISKKIKDYGIAKEAVGFAIVGSFRGVELIEEI
ncbi:MAG: hypothetical protein PHF46_03410 [Candidatus Gracilibacteria bacterium]|nr:hypothetical protein [Candidatus Gracilibacteria bacterium]MDD4530504.1 hypothetical protein [Candidatus Gracilibacteria bacterium]